MFMEREDGRTWASMKTENDHLDSSGNWSENTVSVAYVWIKQGRICLISVTRSSPTGDWIQWLDYSYRSDGTIARISSGFFAYAPEDGGVLREMLFAPDGERIHQGANYTSLNGKHSFTGAKADRLREIEHPVRVVKRSKDWGFIPLLSSS